MSGPAIRFTREDRYDVAREVVRWLPADRVELLHALCVSLVAHLSDREVCELSARLEPLLSALTPDYTFMDAVGIMVELSGLLQQQVRRSS